VRHRHLAMRWGGVTTREKQASLHPPTKRASLRNVRRLEIQSKHRACLSMYCIVR
jgi:hypothetical protein